MSNRREDWDTTCLGTSNGAGESVRLKAYVSTKGTNYYVCPHYNRGFCTLFRWAQECALGGSSHGQHRLAIVDNSDAYK